MFADSDDEVLPNFIETAVNAIISDEEYDILCLDFKKVMVITFLLKLIQLKNRKL